MLKTNTVKALFIITGLPILILLFYFGNSPLDVYSRDSDNIKIIVLLLTLTLVPLILRSYFKAKKQPVTKPAMLGALVGISIIIMPLAFLLRSLALDAQLYYVNCVNDTGLEQFCREGSKFYIDGIYLSGGLEPGLVTFVMFYTIAMVVIIGRKDHLNK